MKRFLIATALTASLSTAAFAATSAEQAQIEAFLPSVDATALTEEQMTLSLEVLNSDLPRAQKLDRMNLILSAGMEMAVEAVPTEAQQTEIARYMPDVDYSVLTQAQIDAAMLVIGSGESPSDIEGKVKTILQSDATPVGTNNTASAAEMAILQRYIPDMAVDQMSEAELNAAMAIVYSGGSESEIQGKLQALTNS
ncbi:hypothetical protein [Puniceibacterium confluentis]|uniref:hypothetical protein n=1 Tax=Puniceibacterium confluentis TaxID=1958944 RepID=UPI0011B478E6|nr:hypothetical protein [Puniceibacterium confluentis]